MAFILMALKIYYILDPLLPPLPKLTDKELDKIKTQSKKCEEYELICHKHILNTLTNNLKDLYLNFMFPKEI